MGKLRTEQATCLSVIIANLSPRCFVGSQSTFLKNWLGDVSSKDGTCKSSFHVQPLSMRDEKGISQQSPILHHRSEA